MTLTRFAAPAVTPVTLDEARAHCKADSADDTVLQIYLDAAVSHLDGAEGTLGRCLVTQTWDYTLDAFPAVIDVPLPVLQSVTSVSYVDANGDPQTMDSADYRVSGQTITPGDDGWPATDNVTGAVTVRFVAGYGVAAAVPAAIKGAILLYIGDLYANREAGGEQLFTNPAAAALTRPFKRVRV